MNQTNNGAQPGVNTSHEKAMSTLRAKLALAGHAVHLTTDGSFWVSKYDLSYFAKDFDDLQAFARKLGIK